MLSTGHAFQQNLRLKLRHPVNFIENEHNECPKLPLSLLPIKGNIKKHFQTKITIFSLQIDHKRHTQAQKNNLLLQIHHTSVKT